MTKIKICGIASLPDALSAIEAGADYLGFNFYLQSPRFIQMGDCARITSVLRSEHASVKLVGVFVNSSVDKISTTMRLCSLDLAQLHGDESAEFRSLFGERAFKALRGVQAVEAAPYAREEPPAFLVDAAIKGAYGGTGRTADWSAASRLAKRYPLLLAGGLTPENVGAAVRQVRPWGVDTASGVESRPGSKDEAKMKAFVKAVRDAEQESK